MAGFLYFLPTTKKQIERTDLVKIDFPFYDNALLPGRHVERDGPGHEVGSVFQLTGQTNPRAESPTPIGYYPDDQEWACAGKYWIGWRKDAPPTPIDLERRMNVSGHPVKLLDGIEWLVPAVRQVNGLNTLPQVWGLDSEGNNCTVTSPEHELLWDKACMLFDFYTGNEESVKGMELTYDDSLTIAAQALAVNYLLGEKEIRARKMCGNEELQMLGKAIVDLPTFEKIMAEMDAKKKRQFSLRDDVQADPVGERTDADV